MHVEDAAAFIVDFVRNPRPDEGYSTQGYEIHLPIVIAAYIREIEQSTQHPTEVFNGPRLVELSPTFYDAAWELCRRGVLRPSIKKANEYVMPAGGDGYTLTALGRKWIAQGDPSLILLEPGRMGQLFGKLSQHLGAGFLQRANEAVRCYAFGAHLASCAMCGAATESILLAIASAKIGEDAALKLYRARDGRRQTTEIVIGSASRALAEPFRSATSLLNYWRDEAAHGRPSTISEIEAYTAIGRLLGFAQFASDNWTELTRP